MDCTSASSVTLPGTCRSMKMLLQLSGPESMHCMQNMVHQSRDSSAFWLRPVRNTALYPESATGESATLHCIQNMVYQSRDSTAFWLRESRLPETPQHCIVSRTWCTRAETHQRSDSERVGHRRLRNTALYPEHGAPEQGLSSVLTPRESATGDSATLHCIPNMVHQSRDSTAFWLRESRPPETPQHYIVSRTWCTRAGTQQRSDSERVGHRTLRNTALYPEHGAPEQRLISVLTPRESATGDSATRHCIQNITPGVGWVNFFRWEPVPYLSEYVCQIWLQSDGRVEKGGGGTDRQTNGHCSFI